MPQRNVTITEQQDAFVEAALKSGQYGNVSEVFRAGLRLLEREEHARILDRDIILRAIDKGADDIKDGRYTVVRNQDDLDRFFSEKRTKREKWIADQNA